MDRQRLLLKGGIFEAMLGRRLMSAFPGSLLLINKELYSPALGKNTQIDIIMVDKKGVFVIEAKNWSKWIKGEYVDPLWKGKGDSINVMTVISPIDQNFLHIRTLRNAIRSQGFDVPPFHSIICLPDGTDIYSSCKELCNEAQLVRKIRTIMDKSESEVDVNTMMRLIRQVE